MNIIKYIKNILYSLPFGMKDANDKIINSQQDDINNHISIHQDVEEQRLSDALMKGVVTQEVKDLRYRDYKVYNESKKYKYIGEGETVKIDESYKDLSNFSFTQSNQLICKGVNDVFKELDKNYDNNQYRIKIVYNAFSRYKIESLTYKVKVEIKNNMAYLSFYFIDSKLGENFILNSFINNFRKGFDKKSELNEMIPIINFITYKAENEDDLIEYYFYDNTLINYEIKNDELILKYACNKFKRTSLIEKFKSDSLEEKYRKKEKKDTVLDLTNRIKKCSLCGNEMSIYDGDITEYTYGKPICINCLKKNLYKKK